MADFIQSSRTPEQMLGLAAGPPTNDEKRRATLKAFYAGKQGVELQTRQEDKGYKFGELFPDSFMNYCKVVVRVVKDRFGVISNGLGILPDNEESVSFASIVSNWWVGANLDDEQEQLIEWVLRDGEAAMIVEWDQSTDQPVFISQESWDGVSNTGVRFFASEANDQLIEFAAKFWNVTVEGTDGQEINTMTRLTIYTPPINGRRPTITRYFAPDASIGNEASGDSFKLLTPEMIENEIGAAAPNPQTLNIDFMPVIRFENSPKESELIDILVAQKMLNGGAQDADTAADFNALPVLVVEGIGAETTTYRPGDLIDAKSASRIEGADLSSLWNGHIQPILDKMIAGVKSWPVWILNKLEGSVPSGVALQTQERSLVAQIEAKQGTFNKSWRDAFSVARAWNNAFTREQIDPEARLLLKWRPAGTKDANQETKIQVETAKLAGWPDTEIWRLIYGFNDEQIAGMIFARQFDPDLWDKIASIWQTMSSALLSEVAMASVAGKILGVDMLEAEDKTALEAFLLELIQVAEPIPETAAAIPATVETVEAGQSEDFINEVTNGN